MTCSFNLIDQSWIPCIMLDGSHTELSLRDTLLHAHEIREVSDQSPLVTAALHRLLLAILHRNFGPASCSKWQILWQAKQFDRDRLGSYFSQWYARFDLFDDRYPFYQVAGLEQTPKKVKEVEVNDLLPELARGNNWTLFDHTTDQTSPSLRPADAFRTILALQIYKLAGLSGIGKNYVDAPLARAVYFLVGGETLFETLLLNLIPYHGDKPIPVVGRDLPVWEQDHLEISDIPRGYLDYLTWQTLSLRLLPTQTLDGDIEVARACLRLGRNFVRGEIFDPGCAYKKNPRARPDQDPWSFHRYEQDRALWRDSALLLRLTDKDRRPSILEWMSQLLDSGTLDEQKPCRLIAYGQCSDKASILFWRVEHLPLPEQYLTDEDLVETLDIALKSTEEVAGILKRTIETFAEYVLYPLKAKENLSKGQKDEVKDLVDHLRAPEVYWSALEVPFLDFMRDLPKDPDTVLEDWNKRIEQFVHQAFEEATNDLDRSARVLRAIAEGQSLLTQLVHNVLSQNS